MTCVVGMVTDGIVYIGADSLGIGGYSKTVRGDSKVFVNGEFLMGFTSSYRMGQLLRYVFTPPARSKDVEDDMEYLVAHFIPALIDTYKKGQYLTKKDDSAVGGNFLLGYRGALYNVESDFQVGIPTLKYDSVGCGADLALGAMHVLHDMRDLTPETKIKTALQAASVHSAGVGGHFEVLYI